MLMEEQTPAEDTKQDAEALWVLKKILEGMSVSATIESLHRDDRLILNVICTVDDSMVIGRRGKTLDAIQFIVNLIVGRKFTDKKPVVIDVNGYRERRKKNLIELARRTAESVKENRSLVAIGPYNAYERYVIHNAVGNDRLVETKSQGEGEPKKILFKLKDGEDQTLS